MSVAYLRELAGRNRTHQGNRHLAFILSAIAGAVNAGGFLAVGQYTSHMSGIISAMADHLALGSVTLMLAGAACLFFFGAGAATSAVMINWSRRRHLHAEYAMPLMLEALLLLVFAVLGGNMVTHEWLFIPVTVILLCFVMGLQNAMITKLSRAEIRTTHVTGMVTDIGIELGKMIYWNRHDYPEGRVRADMDKLKNLSILVFLFFLGGFIGALGFKHIGFVFGVPLAGMLVFLALVPVIDDLRHFLRRD